MLGVEPVVALVGLFGELIVLHIAAANENLKPARRFERARREGALLLFFAGGFFEVIRLLQFAANFIEFLLRLRLRKLLQHAL